MMTEQDRLWLEKCQENKDKYTVFVDNDEIFVVENETDEVVHTFEEYGYVFARDLLHHIGCETDFV